LRVERKSESKLLDRSYVEVELEGRAGKVTRKEAIDSVAQELGVPAENVGLLRIDGESGTARVVGKLYVYGSAESRRRLHPRHLDERLLTKEEREKLKQDRKKAAAKAPAPEAKK
jgi:ribosomal protein S24E